MEVNLTLIASEALNDIVLHHLQNEGLASAEKWEQDFYQAFRNLSSGSSPLPEQMFETEISADVDIYKSGVGEDYQFIYVVANNSITILNICHTSRTTKAAIA
jgi:plasmid stabilization system protein ParE